MKHSFPKNEKLKSRKLIERLFKEGRNIKMFPLKAVVLEIPSLEKNQVAFAVPKKHFNLAVSRNRIKRLMRESYRKHKEETINKHGKKFAVIFIFLGKEIPAYAQLETVMHSLLKKCCK